MLVAADRAGKGKGVEGGGVAEVYGCGDAAAAGDLTLDLFGLGTLNVSPALSQNQ